MFPKTTLLLFILCVFLQISHGQDQGIIDSLNNRLTELPASEEKAGVYFALYRQYLYNEPEKARSYIDKALELSNELDYSRGKILAYEKYGGWSMVHSDYPTAIEYLSIADSLLQFDDWPRQKAVIYGNFAACYKDMSMFDSSLVWTDKFIQLAIETENEGFKAYGYSLQANIYYLKGQNELATRTYIKCLKIYEATGDEVRMADIYRLLGQAQAKAGYYQKSKDNTEKAVEIYKKYNDQYYLAQSYRDLGVNAYFREKYDEAEQYHLQSLAIEEELVSTFGVAQSKESLAEIALEKGDTKTAFQLSMEAIKIFQEIEDPFSEAGLHKVLGEIYLKEKKYIDAESSLHLAEKMLIDLDSPTLLGSVYQVLYELYDEMGQTAQALDAFENHVIISDSLYTVEKARKLDEVQTIYEVEKKDQEIELLSKDVALGKLRRLLLLIGLVAALLIGGLVIYTLMMRRREERKIEEERRLRQEAELEKNKLEKDQLERELASQVLQLCRKNEMLAAVQQEVSDLASQGQAHQKTDFKKTRKIHSIQYTIG